MTLRRSMALLVMGFAAACDSPDTLGPAIDGASDPAFSSISAPPHALQVLNWNVYIGADVDAVIAALASPDPTDDLPALLSAIATLQATDWPSRAAAIADEVARRRPHVIGLQEVSEIAIDLTALGLPIVIQLDFFPILAGALAARGLNYSLVAMNDNIDASPFPGIHVLDHDALLVDAQRVTVLSSAAMTFANNIGVVAPGVDIKRGWVSVDASIGGETYRFISTHLESGPGPQLTGLRALQALELVAATADAPRVVLMGDLNEEDTSPMYGVLSAAGYTDVWATLRPGAAGLTCCHLPDLSNKVQRFDQRIDYVLTRGIGHRKAGVLGKIDRLGEVPADRIDGPTHSIWPSDHAGLAANLIHQGR